MNGLFAVLITATAFSGLVAFTLVLAWRQRRLKSEHERSREEVAQIRQELAYYHLLAENINEVFFILDFPSLRYVYVSPSISRINGYTKEEATRLTFDQHMTPATLAFVSRSLAQALEDEGRPGVDPNRFVVLETEQYRKDGSTFWMEATVRALRDESGGITFLVGVGRDVTDRKQAETFLCESERRYRMLAETISELIYILDLGTMRYTFVTPSVQHLFGYTVEEFLTLPLDRVIAPSSYERSLNAIRDAVETDKQPGLDPDRFDTFELEISRRDGGTLWVESNARFLRDEAGRPISILGVIRDITERKKVEADLKKAKETAEAANQAKSEFLANMSHEIRTPMNGVIGMTDLLLDTPLSVEQREYVESLRVSAEMLLSIINEVLDFSKIESGRLELENIDFDLGVLCRGVGDAILPKARQKHLTFHIDLADNVPVLLKGDPLRLRQVLLNFCDNAVKFTASGQIRVGISVDHQNETAVGLRFEVADTGIGIPDEQQQKIFDAFTQVDASTTRKYGGTGLGLAISRRIVSLLGGEIGLVSQPGRGAVFHFLVTLEKQRPCPIPIQAQNRPARAASDDRRKLKILIVEDNPISLKVIAQMVERLGHDCFMAVNGAEAVESFAQKPFDLVLMDIQMPVMDGITATRHIQGLQRHSGRKVPIIALTANAVAGDRERFLNQGLDDYIPKPLRLDTLRTVIRHHTIE